MSMIPPFIRCLPTTALSLILTGGSLLAQGAPAGALGVGEAGARDAARPVLPDPAHAPKHKEPAPGDEEILLLQRAENFYTKLSLATTYNTNAFYDYRELDDWSLDSEFVLGARTVLGGSFYVDVAFDMRRSDFDTYDSLSRNVLGGRATLGGLIGGVVPFGFSWAGDWYFDKDFDDNYLSFQTLSVSVPVYSVKLASGVGLNVVPYYNWVQTDPDTYDQHVPGLAVGVNVMVSDKTTVSLTVLESYSYYEHYLPHVFRDRRREDWSTAVVLGVTHQFSENLQLRLEARYTNNNSTLQALEFSSGNIVDLYDYDSWIFTPSVALSYTF